MRLVIATPTGIVIDNRDVASTRAEDASGSFGILDGHADFLTALSVCVVSWREKNGAQRFCAVRRGTLAVRNGSEVSIATREALVGDDLERLEGVVLHEFRQAAEAEIASRAANLQMQMAVVRQIIRYLRPQKQGLLGGGP
ncbi:MAG: F0F1 ATP synthase subunit epsilon [Methylovirgula sp.]